MRDQAILGDAPWRFRCGRKRPLLWAVAERYSRASVARNGTICALCGPPLRYLVVNRSAGGDRLWQSLSNACHRAVPAKFDVAKFTAKSVLNRLRGELAKSERAECVAVNVAGYPTPPDNG